MEVIKLTCINCPLGCALEVRYIDEEYVVTGNRCNRGKKYALAEISNPTRISMNEIIVANILDSGIDIVATKSIGGDELYG